MLELAAIAVLTVASSEVKAWTPTKVGGVGSRGAAPAISVVAGAWFREERELIMELEVVNEVPWLVAGALASEKERTGCRRSRIRVRV